MKKMLAGCLLCLSAVFVNLGTASALMVAVLLFNILARVIGNRLLKAYGGK